MENRMIEVQEKHSDADDTFYCPLNIHYSPKVARVFGLLDALLIQVIHYWTIVDPQQKAGEHWCSNSYEAWAKQLGELRSAQTVRKHIKKLEKQGILIAAVLNNHKYDRTRWYRINYVALSIAMGEALGGVWCVVPSPPDTSSPSEDFSG
jgi:hypothetical protein